LNKADPLKVVLPFIQSMNNLKISVLLILVSAMYLISCDSSVQNKQSHEFKISKSEEEWKQELTPAQFQVLRKKDTERAWSGEYNDHHEEGIYICAGCRHPVFSSAHKFESGSGWPSFTEPYDPEAVLVDIDHSYGMVREEILCANCGGHLGHKFPDGPSDKGGQRYCINSLSMDFKKNK
jgi:peptide-methionine (R)-S-oxide reductase